MDYTNQFKNIGYMLIILLVFDLVVLINCGEMSKAESNAIPQLIKIMYFFSGMTAIGIIILGGYLECLIDGERRRIEREEGRATGEES